MHRREVIAALTALPGLASIERATVRPTDVLVLSVDRSISADDAAQLRATLHLAWPDQRVVVLGRGMTLKVLSDAR
jgi:hypothetical protein